ncbi:hypothetical protein BC828DRAFT_374459 [Blastocladiella britannica]|nr:hypothetical protein BC828DRAFT_374459 [Blastocladiella britannica]
MRRLVRVVGVVGGGDGEHGRRAGGGARWLDRARVGRVGPGVDGRRPFALALVPVGKTHAVDRPPRVQHDPAQVHDRHVVDLHREPGGDSRRRVLDIGRHGHHGRSCWRCSARSRPWGVHARCIGGGGSSSSRRSLGLARPGLVLDCCRSTTIATATDYGRSRQRGYRQRCCFRERQRRWRRWRWKRRESSTKSTSMSRSRSNNRRGLAGQVFFDRDHVGVEPRSHHPRRVQLRVGGRRGLGEVPDLAPCVAQLVLCRRQR